MIKKRVAIYARVSTTRDQSPECQLDDLQRFCAARGWEVTEKIVDHGFSGASEKRPGLKKLLELTRSRKIDVVVVSKLDRLFRSMRHLVLTLQDFSELGIEFISLHDQIDLTTASGRLMFHLIASFGEFERELIRERTILGVNFARQSGKRLGRPPTINECAVRQLRGQGLTYFEIQSRLGISKGAVSRALHSAPKSSPNEPSKNGGLTADFSEEISAPKAGDLGTPDKGAA